MGRLQLKLTFYPGKLAFDTKIETTKQTNGQLAA